MEAYIDDYFCDIQHLGSRLLSILRTMEKGLADSSNCIPMLPTYCDIPNRDESGVVLALDFGGTNFRCLLLRLDHGLVSESRQKSRFVDPKTPTGDELFGILADFTSEFLQNNIDFFGGAFPEQLNTGFTFSFPMNQHSLTSGFLIHWTKEFIASGVVGYDVADFIQSKLIEKGFGWVKICALCNDTVGALCAGIIEHKDAKIGVIIGTGTNAAYRERTDDIVKIMKKMNEQGSSQEQEQVLDHILINTEWGEYDGFHDTEADLIVLDKTKHVGDERFEKKTSGMYLPMIARESIRNWIDNRWIFQNYGGKNANDLFEEWDSKNELSPLEIEFSVRDESADLNYLKKTLLSKLTLKIGSESLILVIIQKLFKGIVERSSRYSAVMVVAVALHVHILETEESLQTLIVFDGSIYNKYVGYKDELQKSIDRCIELHCQPEHIVEVAKALRRGKNEQERNLLYRRLLKRKIEIKCYSTSDGSGIGAGIVTATATKASSASASKTATSGLGETANVQVLKTE
ncbi:MAG: Hexokinase [Streblomastix strix]|uniref:Phosphotransferase n=1 Tax=Streblomastix strix TaxID=222440 RepID=A0A5J4WR13_9EUKA|nr:MAG: Hexokinase [Streblomastix strix]